MACIKKIVENWRGKVSAWLEGMMLREGWYTIIHGADISYD
jgi:hypothetical protein